MTPPRASAHQAAIRKGATLQPVKLENGAIVHEYVYGIERSNDHLMAFAAMNYHERVVWRLEHEKEWQLMDGRFGIAKRFRRRARELKR